MSEPTPAEVVALRGALISALELAEDMRPYVPEYFATKWHHDRDLEALRQAVARFALNGEAER